MYFRKVMSLAMQYWSRRALPKGYWKKRRHLAYYGKVLSLAKAYCHDGGQVLDVGAADTEIVAEMDWVTRRVALDRYPIARLAPLESLTIDFMQYAPPRRFDLVLCLQVLEHVQAPSPFAQRLFETGNIVIISVPYKWPRGFCRHHLQDPIDETKLYDWTQRDPVETVIVADGLERLIAVYR